MLNGIKKCPQNAGQSDFYQKSGDFQFAGRPVRRNSLVRQAAILQRSQNNSNFAR